MDYILINQICSTCHSSIYKIKHKKTNAYYALKMVKSNEHGQNESILCELFIL